MKIFLICLVRGITDEERNVIELYVQELEEAGHINPLARGGENDYAKLSDVV